jgi:hypothetical protein
MVVHHPLNADPSYELTVDAPVWLERDRFVIRAEHEAIRAGKANRELAGPIAGQGMAVARHSSHVSQRGRGHEGLEAPLDQRPAFGAETSDAVPIVQAVPFEFPAGPRDLDLSSSLTNYNPKGYNAVCHGEFFHATPALAS